MEKAIEFLKKRLNEYKAQRFTSVHNTRIQSIEVVLEILENEQKEEKR